MEDLRHWQRTNKYGITITVQPSFYGGDFRLWLCKAKGHPTVAESGSYTGLVKQARILFKHLKPSK